MKYKPEELISYFLLNPDSMTQEQADAFSQWIKESPDNRRLFIQSSLVHRSIHEHFCEIDAASGHFFDDLNDSGSGKNPLEEELWEQLSRQERDAPALEVEEDEPEDIKHPLDKDQNQSERTYPKGYLWFSVISIAATVLLFAYVWSHPRHIPEDIATVVDAYQVKMDGFASVHKGMRLFNDRKPLCLREGVLKIQFDNGVQVVIEGPAEFIPEEYERMKLDYGRLYARVPKQAIGFRVNTPQCSVIDLGTEFGVNVNPMGETDVHLFKGKASLVTSSQGQKQQSLILKPNEAKRVLSSGQIRPISFMDRQFVRDFNSDHSIVWNGNDLSLVSIVSGGSGFGDINQNMGIDQGSGLLVSGAAEDWDKIDVKGYVAVDRLDYVDGVFVPDGSNGPVQLTSAGHIYNDFADTDGKYLISIGAHSRVNMYMPGTRSDRGETLIYLEGYPPQTAANLCIHANSGITFDLQKMREHMPFADVSEFSSVYGIPQTREDQTFVDADFYVFVDGEPRMLKKGVSNQDGPQKVTIPLERDDRFLTLVCTQGEQNYGDWSLFVNPTLKLELAD